MKTFDEIKLTLAKEKERLRRNYKVKKIGIFGSYVRGEERSRSDVDVLVEFDEAADLSLLDFIRLENHLSEVLGIKVDLVEKETLKPRIGKHVLEEVVAV